MGEPYYIGGQPTRSPNSIPVIFSYTGEKYAEVCIAGMEDQARAADCVTRGFAETKILPVHRRAEILRRFADKIEEHREEFVQILVHESGKPVRQAHREVTRAVSVMRMSAEESVRIIGKVIPMDSTEFGDGYTGYYYKVPSDPVLCITPFNYPLNLVCYKIGPAIAAGCSFVLKPSTKTPLSALLLASLILEKAGYPANAVNVVPCFGSNAETLVRDPRFNSDFNEVIRMVNESRYGLQGSVFTNSLDVVEKAAMEFEGGTLVINDYSTFRADSMPSGGIKFSGIGREGPKYLIEEFMEKRLMVVRHHFSLV